MRFQLSRGLPLALLFGASVLLIASTIAMAGDDEGASQPSVAQRERGGRGQSGRAQGKRGTAMRIEKFIVPVWLGNSPATALDPDTFEATLGSKKTQVLSARPATEPLLLFVAIDFSDDLILTEAAKDALVKSLARAKPNVLVSLLRIPEQPMVILDPSADRQDFEKALRALPMSGRAGFFEMADVVATVTNPVLNANKIRAAVLYLTDSEIRNYRQDYTNPVINSADSRDLSRRFPDALIREKVNSLTNELLRTSVPIFVVHLNYRSDPLNEAYQTGLKRLAESTGGRGVFCRSIAEIPVAVDDIVNAVQAMGMLEIAVPPGVSGAVTLNLQTSAGTLNYRTLYEIAR